MSCFDLMGCALDGINSEGLTVALLADLDPREAGMLEPAAGLGVGLDEVAVPRFLLETCATVDEAKRALLRTNQFYRGMPSHFIVGDAEGNAFVCQYSNLRNRPRIIEQADAPLCVTNHQLVRKEPAVNDGLKETVGRLEQLRKAVASTSERFDAQSIRRANAAVAQRQRAGEGLYASAAPTRTLWTALWDTQDRSVEIDSYLSEDEIDGAPRIQRTDPMTFALAS